MAGLAIYVALATRHTGVQRRYKSLLAREERLGHSPLSIELYPAEFGKSESATHSGRLRIEN